MWYLLYNLGLVLASPVILLVLLSKKRCRRGLGQRLGDVPSSSPDAQTIWVHAVSLGEVTAVAPLVQALHERFPRHHIVVSTVTETGREAVEQRLAGAAVHCYAPLDFPWVVPRVVDRIRPQLFVFVETELWPNLLRALARRHVPAVLVNGRLSTKSFRGYRLIRPFWSRVLAQVRWLLMQSARDAERVLALGAPASRVRRTGNIKFDQPPPASRDELTRHALGLAEDEDLILGGSTHPVEEEQLLDCYRELQREHPRLVLMLAPRHIERAADLCATARARGFPVRCRSEGNGSTRPASSGTAPRVIVLDTRGELAALYQHAVLAFVGGTLVPVGGHNLLEPAQWGTPVVFGPHTDHCAEIAGLLVQTGGGVQVRDARELRAEMGRKLRDRQALREMGRLAQAAVEDNRGALARNLEVLAEVLTDHEPGPTAGSMAGNRDALGRVQRAPLARPLLRLLARLYGAVVGTRNWLYEHGWLPRRRLPRPVVSIGNLTVGGTGKTPLVIFVTSRLLDQGARVAVLSRGYRRAGTQDPLLVSDGRTVLAGPAEAGDEPVLIARRCPGAIVAVGRDRYRTGLSVLDRFPVDCFVLDDGFQHRRLARTADLVLVDATDVDGMQALLPAGRLREPLSAVTRASAVLVTRVESAPGWQETLGAALARTGRSQPPFEVAVTGDCVVDVRSGESRDLGTLKGTSAFLFSGIANPHSFRRLARQCGADVVGERVFADHHVYTHADMTALLEVARDRHATVLLTTEKDATKIATLLPPDVPVLALRVGVELIEGRQELQALLQGVTRATPTAACA